MVSRPTRPTPLATGADPDAQEAYDVDMDIYREDVKNLVKQKNSLEDNMGRTFEIVWGQCTQAMRAKVEAQGSCTTVCNTSDLLGLLRLIKLASFDFHSQKMHFTR